jgi:hypothetical protein
VFPACVGVQDRGAECGKALLWWQRREITRERLTLQVSLLFSCRRKSLYITHGSCEAGIRFLNLCLRAKAHPTTTISNYIPTATAEDSMHISIQGLNIRYKHYRIEPPFWGGSPALPWEKQKKKKRSTAEDSIVITVLVLCPTLGQHPIMGQQ